MEDFEAEMSNDTDAVSDMVIVTQPVPVALERDRWGQGVQFVDMLTLLYPLTRTHDVQLSAQPFASSQKYPGEQGVHSSARSLE